MKKITIIYLVFLSTVINAQTLKGIYITQNQTGIGGDKKISEKAKIPKLYKYTYSKNKSNLILLNNGGKIIDTLKKKLSESNSDNVTLNDLKAVYRRGLGAYSSSHRPTISGGKPNTRNAWAMARVNKFLLKASGEKVKKAYIQDDDLL